ncbi:MAG: type II toxin-antitoxin system VapC family toxin [Acidobacteriota bacterium]
MIWFADTSALVKRYVRESGSEWVRREIRNHKVLIAQITPVEVAAALGKNLAKGKISEFSFYQARRRFLLHIKQHQYRIVQLSDRIIGEAMRLTSAHSLRAYDAVQLATALIAVGALDRSQFLFITSDSNLEKASFKEGLPSINPVTR